MNSEEIINKRMGLAAHFSAFPSKEFVSDVISIPEGIKLSSLNQGISLLVGIL